MKAYLVRIEYILPRVGEMQHHSFYFESPENVVTLEDFFKLVNDEASVRLQHHTRGHERKIKGVFVKTEPTQ